MSYFLNQKCIESFDPEHTYTFIGPDIFSKKIVSVTVKGEDLFAYNQGAYIQDAFPYIDPAKRDWMMCGMLTDDM